MLQAPIELQATPDIGLYRLPMQSITTAEIAAIKAVGVETSLPSLVLTLQEIIHLWVWVATCIHYCL